MTLRPHMLKPNLDVSIGAFKKVPTSAAPSKSEDDTAVATSSALSATIPSKASDAAAVKDTTDNVASREDGGAHSLSAARAPEQKDRAASSTAKYAHANLVAAPEMPTAQGEASAGSAEEAKFSTADAQGTLQAEHRNPPPTKTALELAIDRCTALGDKSDTMISEKWAKRAAPILAESLNFLAEYKAATEAEREAVRARLKAKSGVSRQPNVDNLPLIAVYMCVSCAAKTRTKEQRKAWGRFKTVVAVAAAVSVVPEGAAKWLENKTLNGILAEWQEMQKANGKGRKASVPKALKLYAHLAAALALGSEFHDLAAKELAKADAAIAEAMMKAAPPAPETSVVSPAQKATLHA